MSSYSFFVSTPARLSDKAGINWVLSCVIKLYKPYPHPCCQSKTHTLVLFSSVFLPSISLIFFFSDAPTSFPSPSSFPSVIMAWRGVVKFMTFRSRGAGWRRTRIVSQVPAGICLSLMSELYNVSTPDNLALAICGRERGSHLLHLVTEQWLPLRCLFLLLSFITVLTSNVCTTIRGIIDVVRKIEKKKDSLLCSLIILGGFLFCSLSLFLYVSVSLFHEAHHRLYTLLLCLKFKVVCVKHGSQTAPETLSSVRGWKVVPLSNSER